MPINEDTNAAQTPAPVPEPRAARNRPRNAWEVQRAVFHALLLREAVTRLCAGRAPWLWILLEPVSHLAFIMVLLGFVLHQMTAGVDSGMFVATGVLGFLLVRNTALRSMEAVSANGALFTYRQVLPVDTVLVRALLEGIIAAGTAVVLMGAAAFFGYDVLPHDPLKVLLACLGLWLAGTGLGLVFSVASEQVAELGKLIHLLFRPLYFLSGVMFPAMAVPQPYRGWLMCNPLLNAMELIRDGYFRQYHAAPETSALYLLGFALMTLCLGLALHVRYAERIVAQ